MCLLKVVHWDSTDTRGKECSIPEPRHQGTIQKLMVVMNSTKVQNPRRNSMQALDAGIMQYAVVRKMILCST